MIKNKTGVWGELFAARYLRKNKYEILGSNYVCRFGELDIIARDGRTICFIEVKTRNENTRFRPSEAVDESKRKKLEMAAKSFVTAFDFDGPMRFDVFEVYVDDNDNLIDINHIKNAF
mgnify:CR=1 FL=1